MNSDSVEHVLDEIISSLYMNFGLKVVDTNVINKGWLNVKWRFITDKGPVFVKYYHPNRYKLHVQERRSLIEKTLLLQQRLHSQGMACPRVYSIDGQFIQKTSGGYHFAMMDWASGSAAEAGAMSIPHMYDLGKSAGLMHQLLQDVDLDPSAWKPDQSVCLADLHKNLEQARNEQSIYLIELLEQAIKHVQSLDFTIFNESPIGWTHWDLWADNIVLDEHGIAGIVDFDRMAVAYPEIDVARAILSGAFNSQGIRKDAMQAFLAGYREHMEVPTGLLVRCIKMLYLIESTWWLRTEMMGNHAVPKRFMEEMVWLTKFWEHLSAMCME